MGKVLQIGCGGVGTVAAHKLAQNADIFTEIMIASRTKKKCDALADVLYKKYGVKVATAAVDADDVDSLVALMKSFQPEMVINLALPYQDLAIMVVAIILILQIMNQRMRLILNIHGSGHIRNVLRMPD